MSHLFSIVFFPYTNPPFFFSLATGARRQHRGPRSGGKKTLDKQSYQRREKLFNASAPNNDAVLHALPTEASRDRRTEEEIDAVLPWVRFGLLMLFLLSSNTFISRLRGLWPNIHFALQILLPLLPHAWLQSQCVCRVSCLLTLTRFPPATTSVGAAGHPLQARCTTLKNSY